MASTRVSLDVLVVGGGISGLATLKCLRDAAVQRLLLLERSDRVGGLWVFRENDPYGVMAFTHINVSKANYCFSDWPFPAEVPDYPHHSQIAAYAQSYVDAFGLKEMIRFGTEVLEVCEEEEHFVVKARDVASGAVITYVADFVAIATGHHVEPSVPRFEGTFGGTSVVHSSAFKSSTLANLSGNVLVVGIGNSAVDVAVNAAVSSQVDKVFLSTRSGAWVLPNYVFGYPTDHYACRFFLKFLPSQLANAILETIVKLLHGDPRWWKLNPKMRVLSAQPTVSPTLIHHIQRGNVEVVSNVARFAGGREVVLEDGCRVQADHVVMCTGYKIDLAFLSAPLKEAVLHSKSNEVNLYKYVFAPRLGRRLAFIGFVQPSSGGLLPVSEMQARWFAEMVKGRVSLPPQETMEMDIRMEREKNCARYFDSPRHTIQCDPISYNDEIAGFIGAQPSLWRHPSLAWRLLFSSCGTFQWRLQGPHKWEGAYDGVLSVPTTPLMSLAGILLVVIIAALVWVLSRLVAMMI